MTYLTDLLDCVRRTLRWNYRDIRNYEKEAIWEGEHLALVRLTTKESRRSSKKAEQHILLLDKHAWNTVLNSSNTPPLVQLSHATVSQFQLDSLHSPERVYTSNNNDKDLRYGYDRDYTVSEGFDSHGRKHTTLSSHKAYYPFSGRLNKTLLKQIIAYAEQRDKTFATDIEEEAEDREAAHEAEEQLRLEQSERRRAEHAHAEQQRRLALQKDDEHHQSIEDRVRAWALASGVESTGVIRHGNSIHCGDVRVDNRTNGECTISISLPQKDLEEALDALRSFCHLRIPAF